MEKREDLRQLEEKIFHWREDKKRDSWKLTPEELLLLIEDLTLKNVQLVEIEQMQREIVRSQDKYKEVCDCYPYGYLALDENGVIKEANTAVAEILGSGKSSLLNATFDRFVSQESSEIFKSYYLQLIQTRTRQSQDLILKKNSGETIRVKASGIAIIDTIKKSCLCRIVISEVSEQTQPAKLALGTNGDGAELKNYIRQTLYTKLMEMADHHSETAGQ